MATSKKKTPAKKKPASKSKAQPKKKKPAAQAKKPVKAVEDKQTVSVEELIAASTTAELPKVVATPVVKKASAWKRFWASLSGN